MKKKVQSLLSITIAFIIAASVFCFQTAAAEYSTKQVTMLAEFQYAGSVSGVERRGDARRAGASADPLSRDIGQNSRHERRRLARKDGKRGEDNDEWKNLSHDVTMAMPVAH